MLNFPTYFVYQISISFDRFIRVEIIKLITLNNNSSVIIIYKIKKSKLYNIVRRI